jgi:aspartate/methionine/tyrosine aminotransferase
MKGPPNSPVRLASRMSFLEASGIRKMFELVATMEDPINLSIGQPDFDAPAAVKEAAIRAIREGKNKYTVTQGLPELNERIVARLAARDGRRPENSIVTAGVSGALVLSFLVLLDPGDEILLPDPGFVLYRHLARVAGAEPKFYDLYPDFRLDAARLEPLLTPRTKVVVLNTPHNPTGGVYGEADLREVAALAERRGLFLIADEIYEAFVYDGPFRSVGAHTDRALLLGGFSKTYGIPGWRLGWAAGPHAVVDAMRTLQQFSFVCAPSIAQHAALAALDLDVRPWIDAYRRKRDLVVEGLRGAYRLTAPGGSFYAFPSVPDGIAEADFVQRALDRKLLIVPGSSFSARATHFRISFAAPDDELRRGIEVLRSLATSPARA